MPPVMSSPNDVSTGRGLVWSMICRVVIPGTNVGETSTTRGSTAVKSRCASAIVTPGLSRATPL